MSAPEFVGYEKIYRYSRKVIVTEKIDGTNGVIWISDDGTQIVAGSRTQWLTPEKPDNYGFRAWVEANRDDLMKLGPGMHFGEWWGSGIQRRYGLADKRFSLFNVARWGDSQEVSCAKCGFQSALFSPNTCERCGKVLPKQPTPRPACCGVVPVLWTGMHDDLDLPSICADLKSSGSVAAPGYMNPEGVVVFHTASGALFKHTLDGDGHKGVIS